MTVKEFKDWLMPGATAIENKYGIPALFDIAQAALESGWGRSAIGNNIYGIKALGKWTGKKQLVTTTEYHDNQLFKYPEIISITPLPNGRFKYLVKDWFRDYDTIEQCLEDHARILLQPRYKNAFNFKDDPNLFAVEIEKGGYATAPGYAKTIQRIIKMLQSV